MKKVTFLIVLCLLALLAGQTRAYTVTGTVYHKGTTVPVPGAAVTLAVTGGPSNSTSADSFGSFAIVLNNYDGRGQDMTLTASSGFYLGRTAWTANANLESRNVEVQMCAVVAPRGYVDTLVAAPGGSGRVFSPLVINAPIQPIQVKNAQVNINFHPPLVAVDLIEPAPDVTITSAFIGVNSLEVNIEVDPPREVRPDFPAESFFDVFFNVIIPESDAVEARVTVDHAEVVFIPEGGTMPQTDIAPLSSTDTLLGEPAECEAHFLLDNEAEWLEALNGEWPQPNISPMTPAEWHDPDWGYMKQWSEYCEEGDPYPNVEFLPPELRVWPGDNDPGSPQPDDAGLVMVWGDTSSQDGKSYGSAWKYDYGLDPDLTNCIITVTVTPPSAMPISNVSLGMQDVNGNIRSWQWTCGPGGVLPHDVPTTIKIDTALMGTGAANPTATGFTNNPAFDIMLVQFIIADENGTWVAQQPAPPPGGQNPAIWNYWHNLSVFAKTNSYKGSYVKFSQPPQEVGYDLIYGWDVHSVFPYDFDNGTSFTWAADDWKCYDARPVTDVHWWGSFIGWTRPELPPQVPDYFLMAIWKDVPADMSVQPPVSSHPKELLWTHKCYKWVWNYAGADQDPRFEIEYNQQLFGDPQQNETCFQFNQLLSEDEWFYQEPMEVLPDGTVIANVYWLSIAAVYESLPSGQQIEYPWGWKTKPFDSTKAPDPAVVMTMLDPMTPPWDTAFKPGVGGHVTTVQGWYPLVLPDPSVYPNGTWFDLAFELTTNEPKCPGLKADLNDDCIVNLPDFAIMAEEWLKTSP